MRSIGINTALYKMLVFAIGSFFAGIAGVLFAHQYWSIDPTCFGFILTPYMIVWVVVGGTKTFIGPIIGLTALIVLQELLRPLYEWLPLFHGIILYYLDINPAFSTRGLESMPERLSLLVKKVKGAAQE